MKPDTRFWLALAGGSALGAYVLQREVRGEMVASERSTRAPGGHASGRPHQPPARRRTRAQTVKLLRAVSRRFDPIFEAHRGVLPVAYLRALAKRESNMNPRESDGGAWGLLQVVGVVRRDFNKRHGTSFARADLLDPELNVRMATELLQIIVRSYARNHPGVPNMLMDWSNPRFVELLTAGWNGGWSERAGLGRVVSYLEKRGQGEITIDDIFANARAAGATRFLSMPARRRWSKSVARRYMSERLRDHQLARKGT